jgi:hypothetical protein
MQENLIKMKVEYNNNRAPARNYLYRICKINATGWNLAGTTVRSSLIVYILSFTFNH